MIRLRLTKVHKIDQDLIRDLDNMSPLSDAKNLAREAQRGVTFLASRDSPSANRFPVFSNPNLPFSQREFHIALGRKLRPPPFSFLRPYIGARIKSNRDSRPTHVDTHGNGITASHQHQAYLGDDDASTTGWCAAWSDRFERRGYQSRVGTLVHVRTLSANFSMSGCD